MTQQPEAAGTVASRYDTAGDDYFAYQQRSVETANRIVLPRFAPYVHTADRVVDFGCGTGWLLNLLQAKEKVGIEPNPAARKYAAELGVRTVPSADELEDGWADVVISNHALEHSLSPITELQRLRRILKPGGTFVLGLPIDDWRAKAHRHPDGTDPNHHLHTWTPLLITNLLGEAGFEVRSAEAFTYLQPYYNEQIFPRVPRPVFDAMAKVFGRIKRYHQMTVVSRRPLD